MRRAGLIGLALSASLSFVAPNPAVANVAHHGNAPLSVQTQSPTSHPTLDAVAQARLRAHATRVSSGALSIVGQHATQALSTARRYGAKQLAPAPIFCVDGEYTDAVGDSNGLDADAYSVLYDCTNSVWIFSAHVPSGVTAPDLGFFVVWIDRDLNPANGCDGADMLVEGFYQNSQLWYDIANTPSCSSGTWQFRSDRAAVLFGPTSWVSIAIADTSINVNAFRWYLALHDQVSTSSTDFMPDNTRNSVVRPGGSTNTSAWGDFDGDGKSEIAVFRGATGTWYIGGQRPIRFGQFGDIPVPGDYNGDGKSDIALYRPTTGSWYIRGARGIRFGQLGDVPVAGDYNGDGRTDIAVFRENTGTWYVRGGHNVRWGQLGDMPVVGDYNGDHRVDPMVFRPSTGTWYSRGARGIRFGATGDIPLQGDFNGDGRSDIALYRPLTSTWYFRGGRSIRFGAIGDIPVPGDFNGGGASDVAVFRQSNGVWYDRSARNVRFGQLGDLPV